MARGRKSQGSRGGRSSGQSARRARPQTKRHYARTARVNTLVQEIVADYFERMDDEEIGFITITGVEVDNDLNRAQVFISTLVEATGTPEQSIAEDDRLLAALAEHRKPVQAKIGREARLRKTPEVVFVIDPAVRTGARIEEILSGLGPLGDDAEAVPELGDDAEPVPELGDDGDASALQTPPEQ